MNSSVLLAICVVLATSTEALPVATVDTAWLKVADDKYNSVMYYVETKRELFVFGKAVAAPIMTPETNTDTDSSTSAPATCTSAPATSTSAPTTGTSVLSTSSNALSPSSTIPPEALPEDTGSSIRAPATGTSTPATSTSAPATSTSAPATSTSAPTTGTSVLSTSSNALSPSSTIPPGYTYYPAARIYYKFHDRRVTWEVAKATCAREGAQLIVVNDAEEAGIVASIVRDTGYSLTWTGIRDNRPGGVMEWHTVHGKPLSDVYHEWSIGRPYNDAQRICAVLSGSNKRLYDWPCDVRQYFTCQLSQ